MMMMMVMLFFATLVWFFLVKLSELSRRLSEAVFKVVLQWIFSVLASPQRNFFTPLDLRYAPRALVVPVCNTHQPNKPP